MEFCNYVFMHNTLYNIHDTSYGEVAVWVGCEEYEHLAGCKSNPGKNSKQFSFKIKLNF